MEAEAKVPHQPGTGLRNAYVRRMHPCSECVRTGPFAHRQSPEERSPCAAPDSWLTAKGLWMGAHLYRTTRARGTHLQIMVPPLLCWAIFPN